VSDIPRQDELLARYFLQSVQIEPTNLCNIQCVYCRNPRIKHRTTLSSELWDKMIANWNPELFPSHVAICGFGEPFLNKGIYDLFDALSARGTKLFVQSNGRWKLNEARADSFFKIDTLRITVDSIDEEMARVTRPRAHVSDILSNLARVLELRRQRGAERPVVKVQMNVFRHNQHHCSELIRTCKALGVDSVHLSSGNTVLGMHYTLPPAVYETYKNDPFVTVEPTLLESQPLDRYFNRLTLPVSMRVREGQLLAKSVRTLQRLWHDPQVARLRTAGANALLALRKKSPVAAGKGPAGEARAADPGPSFFTQLGCPLLTVRSNGMVTPCCFDTDSTVALGSLLETTMAEILAPANVARVARQIVDGQEERKRMGKNVECDRCPLFRRSAWCRKSPFDVLLRA
jgi:organic radical activating enzyme